MFLIDIGYFINTYHCRVCIIVFCLYVYYYYYYYRLCIILHIILYEQRTEHTILFSHSFFFIEIRYCIVPITVKFLPYFIITTTTTTKQRHDSDELTKYYYGSVSLHYSRLAHKSSLSIIIYSFNNSPNFDNCIICVLCVCAGAVYINQCVKRRHDIERSWTLNYLWSS